MKNMTKQEKEWMAEDDMRTLARAEEIKSDRQRLSRAKQAGTRIVKEKEKEVDAIQKVSKTPMRKMANKKSSPKKPMKRKSSKK